MVLFVGGARKVMGVFHYSLCPYVFQGLLITFHSRRAVSWAFTVLSSEHDTKNT